MFRSGSAKPACNSWRWTWPGTILAIGLLAGASGVQAQSIGWTFNDGVARARFYNPNPAYTYDSANANANAVAIAYASIGKYRVTFKGLGNGLHGNVQVSAGTANFCTAASWSSANGKDVQVAVDCFKPGGGRAPSEFAVLYQERQGWDDRGAGAAYLLYLPQFRRGPPVSPNYSFNSTGKTNNVVRTGTGTYSATLSGLTKRSGVVHVTSFGSAAIHCAATSLGPVGTGIAINVACQNHAGLATDSDFTLAYAIGAPLAWSRPTARGAYAIATKLHDQNDYTPTDQYDSLAQQSDETVLKLGTGQYAVFIPDFHSPATTLPLVTAFNLGAYCNLDDWAGFGVGVDCYDMKGKPADSRFTLSFLTSAKK